jgi:F-type H+-transporting ATPase subunit gamma
MASLKELKVRIASVKNTQKITKAMKMVAAAKLRRATERAVAARPYAEHMEKLMASLATEVVGRDDAPVLLAGTGKQQRHLLVVMTSDRGLCGGFNSSIVRSTKNKIASLQAQGCEVLLFCVGRKGYDQLNMNYGGLIIGHIADLTKKPVSFTEAQMIADKVLGIFEDKECDVVTVVFNAFKSAISQVVTWQQIVPLDLSVSTTSSNPEAASLQYEYEPGEKALLDDLLPRNISVQIFKSLLENSASEQGARMAAMDNATRNAGDMIKKLTLLYNRTRQAAITKELIEIISGAEAV